MLVNYKAETGVRIVPLSDTNPEAVLEKGSVRGQYVMLVPGWNEISDSEWPHVEATMEMDFDNGLYEYQFKEIEEDGKSIRRPLSLGEIRADKAKAIINGCFNPKTLEKWSNDPKLTSEVRSVADIRLKKIEELGKE